jgi:RES domain-containing protein
MLVYRVSPKQYAHDLSGEGSRIYGGRWNPAGRPVIYTSDSASLAMLETVAFYPVSGAPPDLVLVVIEISDSVTIEKPDIGVLPTDWNARPQKPSTSNFGLTWLDTSKASCLRVPSVITPEGYGWNYILNPLHPELAGKMRITESIRWEIDPRIAGKII